jgi:tetratricopeptide (TPR) repeat protein
LGKTSASEAEYRRALDIQEKLAADNPAVTENRNFLAIVHNNLGILLSNMGRSAEAAGEHRAAVAIDEKLVADNPNVPDYRNGLATSHTELSGALRRLGRPAEARDTCDRAIAIREALVQEVPKATKYLSPLAHSYRRRGAGRAMALWEGLPSRSGPEWFDTACAHAALAGLAGRAGSGVSAAEAVTEADAAMALLRKAIEMGYRSPGVFRTEAALDPLRERRDFQKLLAGLEKKTPDQPK